MITLDRDSPVPPYEQIRAAIVRDIEAGELHAGDRIPTVRRLAADLGLAVNTVARAYRELEAAGVVETRGRGGSFVTGGERDRELSRAAREYLARVVALGGDQALAVALVRRVSSH